MIDEKAREIAANVGKLAKSAVHEIKTTIGCLISVYFDRVRWVEFTALVMPPALLAAKFVSTSALPWAAPYVATLVGGYIALTFLRNPKLARWEDTPAAAEAPKETPDASSNSVWHFQAQDRNLDHHKGTYPASGETRRMEQIAWRF